MKTVKFIVLGGVLLALVLAKERSPLEIETFAEIEAETDRLLYDVTMEDFQQERISPSHSLNLDWRNNGCTSAPDKPSGFNFLPSCQRHDFCYLNYRKQGRYEKLKPKCDDNFEQDMIKECRKYAGERSRMCRTVASIYHLAVKTFGDNYDMYQLPPAMLAFLQHGEIPEIAFEENKDALAEIKSSMS